MTTSTVERPRERAPLTRERVIRVAVQRADTGGLEALTMRKLGRELEVEAMALYYHFAHKSDLVDAMVDAVFGEIELPRPDDDWRTAMRQRAISVREAMARHRWAIGLMESRANPGPASLLHHDSVIGNLRANGFDMAMAAHAYSLLDSYIYGFALTKMSLPFDATDDVADVARGMLEPFPVGAYPNLVAFITDHAMKPGYDLEDEFEYGLDVILDAIERTRSPV